MKALAGKHAVQSDVESGPDLPLQLSILEQVAFPL